MPFCLNLRENAYYPFVSNDHSKSIERFDMPECQHGDQLSDPSWLVGRGG